MIAATKEQMKNLIIRELAGAERLWKSLSPRECLYDDWDFRLAFFEPSGAAPYFAAVYQDARPLALLPLQERPDGTLEFFGGSFMEDNRVFVRAGFEALASRLYRSLPAPVELNDIGTRDPSRALFDPEPYPGYVHQLDGLAAGEDFLERNFRSKSKANLKKSFRQLQERWNIRVQPGAANDLDLLFELNIRNFGEDSAFRSPARQAAFRNLYERSPEPVLLTLLADDRKIGASFSLGFGASYVYLNAGVRHDEYSGAGSYLIFANIEEAIKRGKTLFDAGVEDLGWKERWHLTPVPRYRFRKAG